MTDKAHQEIDKALIEYAHKVSEARELALEEMLQRDEGGVLELQSADGRVQFFVTEAVPYGHIFQWVEAFNGPFPWPLPD